MRQLIVTPAGSAHHTRRLARTPSRRDGPVRPPTGSPMRQLGVRRALPTARRCNARWSGLQFIASTIVDPPALTARSAHRSRSSGAVEHRSRPPSTAIAPGESFERHKSTLPPRPRTARAHRSSVHAAGLVVSICLGSLALDQPFAHAHQAHRPTRSRARLISHSTTYAAPNWAQPRGANAALNASAISYDTIARTPDRIVRHLLESEVFRLKWNLA
jgi:hypothetical protein